MSRPAKPAGAAKASAAKNGLGPKDVGELLDEALAETFPASDPVEMLEPAPRGGGADAHAAGNKAAGKSPTGKNRSGKRQRR